MYNIFDYINWRGDLSFEQDKFNELDGLILSRLSYVPFDKILDDGERLTICDAYKAMSKIKINPLKILNENDIPLLKAISSCDRYKDLVLCNYVNAFDPSMEQQFAALTIEFSKRKAFVSFRGTDNTLIGWKEDLNMSYLDEIPSQACATSYLNKLKYKSFIIGGHSKGGNLAIYAASKAPNRIQRRIVSIYNLDGPGFSTGFIATKGYLNIVNKIKTFVPQTSIIGMILNRVETETVVLSNKKNIEQHDVYSWQVECNHFVHLKDRDKDSKMIDDTITTWLNNTNYEQRKELADTIYAILLSGNPKTIDDAFVSTIKNAGKVLKTYNKISPEVKNAVSFCLKLMVKTAKDNIIDSIKKDHFDGKKSKSKSKAKDKNKKN